MTEEEIWTKTLLKESDRGCVIFGAEVLNDYLERLLRCFLRSEEPSVINLLEAYGPLATFSAKIRLCFALKLITKGLRFRLEIVRKMRNIFAHDWTPVDFEEIRLKTLLDQLIGSQEDEEQEIDNRIMPEYGFTREQLIRRLAFTLSVSRMVGSLEFYARIAKEGKDLRTMIMHIEKQERKT